MASYFIWGIPRRGRVRIGVSNASYSPLPFDADIITLVESCDVDLMKRWCRKKAKKGWSIEKLRRSCGEDPE